MTCILCRSHMDVYDRYPLVDGTFFLSPINHGDLGVPVRHEGRDAFLLATCLTCMETAAARLSCLKCGAKNWFLGASLMLGTLYSYDVLASAPCCPPECRGCHTALPLPSAHHQRHFSAFSEPSNCPKCGIRDAHYVRRLDSIRLDPLPATPTQVQQIPVISQQQLSGGPWSRNENGNVTDFVIPGIADMSISPPSDYNSNGFKSPDNATNNPSRSFGDNATAPQTVAA
jgi:predicted nucleic-acid-binding Zn-ribbon protein